MIKQPVFAGIAFLLLFVIGWFVMDRLAFLKTAETTEGKVASVSARNDRCGGRRSKYSCTKFTAHVKYAPKAGGRYTLKVSAGSTRGHGKPVTYADRHQGDPVRVVYSPKNPQEAYEDSVTGVWGTPLMIGFTQIAFFFTSLTEPRRRRSGP